MHTEYHKWYSHNLGHEMTLKRYGNWGYPIIVFPAAKGSYIDYENFGMVDALRPHIESGKIQLISIGSIDEQTWNNKGVHPMHIGPRYEAYDRYVCEEVIPFVREFDWRRPITTGCSMGGYHSANFFFKHPDLFGGCIAMSGCYKLDMFVGDFRDDHVYYNSPLYFLPNVNDPDLLDLYRQGHIVISVGQGRWEDQHRIETKMLEDVLASKGIPAWVDWWGHDVDHDWPWWRQQIPHFIDKLPV